MSLLVSFYRVFAFVLGTTFGVIIAFWILNLSNTSNNNYSTLYNPHSDPLTDSKQYHHWLEHNGFFKIIKDKSSCPKVQILESDLLKQHVKITCVIFITNLVAAYRVYSSWVAKCDNFHFFGQKSNAFIPINTKTYSKYPWQRLCKSLEHLILNERKNLHWMILIQDNTYVIPENLRYSLALLNASEPFYGGLIKSHRSILFSSFNAGIILNVAALEYLLESNSLPCYLQNSVEADYFLGRQLFNNGIYPKSLLDRDRCNRFHSVTMAHTFAVHIQKNQVDNLDLAKSTLIDEKGFCFSRTSVTFKMPLIEKKEMFESVYDYLLYNFRKTPVCYSEDQYLLSPEHSAKMWAKSIAMHTNKTERELISMSDKEFYNLWANISMEIPQTW